MKTAGDCATAITGGTAAIRGASAGASLGGMSGKLLGGRLAAGWSMVVTTG